MNRRLEKKVTKIEYAAGQSKNKLYVYEAPDGADPEETADALDIQSRDGDHVVMLRRFFDHSPPRLLSVTPMRSA